MTSEEIRNARKSFAAQLTNMIRDFERQTGKRIEAINVERSSHKKRDRIDGPNGWHFGEVEVKLFKGVYLAIE